MSEAILVVEDSDEDAKRIAELLEVFAPSVIIARARNRKEAWAKISGAAFSLVVLDLALGGSSEGELLLDTMKGMDSCPPVVIVSAIGSRAAARNLEARHQCVVEVIPKQQLHEMRELFGEAIRRILVPPLKEPGRMLDWKAATPIVVAVVGLLSAISVAVIKSCGVS